METVIQESQSAIHRDQREFFKQKPSLMDYLWHATKKMGGRKKPLSLILEFAKLQRGRGKLTLPEYVQYGVYDEQLSFDEKSRFLTNTGHWPIAHTCCDVTWQAATEDKWLCAHILADSDVPVPTSLAVIDKTGRSFPGTRKISNASQLRDFALAQGQPFFAKENRGICSFGAFLALEAEPDRLHLKGQGWFDYETVMDQFIGSTTYLLQDCQRNHSFFDRYTDNLATVRVCLLVAESGVKVPFAVLKLPTTENVADSFWRPGNIACDLDPDTGTILDARTKDAFGTESYTTHPVSGSPLVGETLPDWTRLIDLVHVCSPIFEPIRYQSMDIALTDSGPVLIEINYGGGFDLPQLASGRGFLTDEVIAFFKSQKVKGF